MPQADQHTQDAPSLAAADEEVADDVENASPDGAARRSSDLPFATAIARLPAIDPQMMGDEPAASEDVPADDTATTDPDASESPAKVTEPTPEEDTHPQVSALASAEQEADHEEQPQDVSVARDLQDDDEQIADAAVAEATDDNAGMNDVEDSPAAVEAVASVDQTEDEEPFLPAESIESLTTVDPTHGNGLLVPMPATLEDGAPTAHATAHPWRILGRQSGSTEKTIWSLPERQSDVGWRPVFADRSHADGPTEAGNVKPPKLAGTTEEMIDRKAPDQP